MIPASQVRDALQREMRRLGRVLDDAKLERERLEFGSRRVAERIRELHVTEDQAHRALDQLQQNLYAATRQRAFPAWTQVPSFPSITYNTHRRLAIMERSFL
jgi:chromosome segregation ATPase